MYLYDLQSFKLFETISFEMTKYGEVLISIFQQFWLVSKRGLGPLGGSWGGSYMLCLLLVVALRFA